MKLTMKEAKKRMEISGGNLDLRGAAITELPEGLTVGGSLDLEGAAITELPEGLTVGGSLYLRGAAITELPEGLTVGGSLYLEGAAITELQMSKVKKLSNGDYVVGKYLYADNILTHVKRVKKIKNYVYYVGKIKDRNVIYDGTYYAHCKDIKSGVSDLIFKHAKTRGSEQYLNLNLSNKLTTEEAKTMYRIITGACQQGTDAFVSSFGDELKDRYTINELLELTNGQYGHKTFRKFFEQ